MTLGLKGPIDGPAASESVVDHIARHTKALRPLCDRQREASMRQVSRTSTISSLLCLRGPSAVLRRVRSVVVNALNTGTAWRLAHVVCKRIELTPSLTYGDAAATVVREPRRVRVAASIDKSAPDVMQARMRATVLELWIAGAGAWPDRFHRSTRRLSHQATAALRVLISQVRQRYDRHAAAIAAASMDPALAANALNYNQPSEALTDDIVRRGSSRHSLNIARGWRC